MPAITKEQNIRHPAYKLYWASVQGGVFNPYRISGVKYSLVPISRIFNPSSGVCPSGLRSYRN